MRFCFRISSVELLKLITCDKPRRAREAVYLRFVPYPPVELLKPITCEKPRRAREVNYVRFCFRISSVELLKLITCEKPRRAREANCVRLCFRISSVELLKMITRYKPRRAREAAAAARFFDESVRNSYARRATTPQTASWRQGEFRAEARKRSRRCVTLVRTPLASVSGAQQKSACSASRARVTDAVRHLHK